MIAYASYTKKDQDTAGDTLWTALINSSISIVAGFVVFATLGFLAMQSGVPLNEVASQGVGLAFVVFPAALSMMPLAGLFSALFFLVLLSLGIDSAFSLIEGIISAFKEKINASNAKIALIVSLVCFSVGLLYVTGAGLYFLDVIDHFITSFGLVLVGISTALVVGWTTNGKKVKDDLEKTSTWFPIHAWWWNIRLVIPLLLSFLIIWTFINELKAPYGGYPPWAIGLAWMCVFLPLVAGWFLNRWYGKANT
ncbi:sodium-dependent transporter, partial [Candidatus Woesearchaeota archaeon]|nr:sodium-dependent transporter [Candidatus Woesearchaeota archaeon]